MFNMCARRPCVVLLKGLYEGTKKKSKKTVFFNSFPGHVRPKKVEDDDMSSEFFTGSVAFILKSGTYTLF